MSPKKEIRINKNVIIGIIACFFISFGLVFILQTFGTFSYQSENKKSSSYEYGADTVILIKYESQLGTIVTNYQFKDSRLGYQVKDMLPGEKFDNYHKKQPYYFKAALNEFGLILIIWGVLSIIIIVKNKIKFKLE